VSFEVSFETASGYHWLKFTLMTLIFDLTMAFVQMNIIVVNTFCGSRLSFNDLTYKKRILLSFFVAWLSFPVICTSLSNWSFLRTTHCTFN